MRTTQKFYWIKKAVSVDILFFIFFYIGRDWYRNENNMWIKQNYLKKTEK